MESYQESKEPGKSQESGSSPKKSVVLFGVCLPCDAMKIRREHLTLLHSNAACQQLALLTGGEKFTHAYEGSRSLMQVRFIVIHRKNI